LAGAAARLGSLGGRPPLTQLPQHQQDPAAYVLAAVGLFLLGLILLAGCLVIGPNEARVLTFFGATPQRQVAGLRWVNPFTNKRDISLRARNFESAKIKVNDIDGNPIEIGAVIVWRVFDTAQATFDVESFTNYVQIQAEAAIRTLAMHHPYDSHEEGVISLPSVGAGCRSAPQGGRRADPGRGCEIVDARIAHLAYAPEIAQAMLQRQQAGAIIAARKLIVEARCRCRDGARAAVQARHRRARQRAQGVDVSNLLVVLCGERSTQPVINAARSTKAPCRSASRSCCASIVGPRALQKWAADDLRSLNAQIEYVLRDALVRQVGLPARRAPVSLTDLVAWRSPGGPRVRWQEWRVRGEPR